MPFFRYRAMDRQGQFRQGTIQAGSPNEARDALVRSGLNVVELQGQGAAAAPQAAPTQGQAQPQARPQARPQAQPQAQTRAQTQAPQPRIAQPQTGMPPETIKTRFGTDKATFLLFSQLARFINSGIAPHRALQELAMQSRRADYRESLERMVAATAEGKSISSVMERYPYLYPPDVVGTTRAGEMGGFLPEARQVVANQAETSHRLKRQMVYYALVLLILIVTYPFTVAVIDGSLASMAIQDKAGGTLPPVATLTKAIKAAMWHILPWAALCYGLLYVALRVWHSMPLRGLRHRTVLMVPVLAGRAKAESLARFGWILSMVSRGGASPQQAFSLAARSVPNLEMARRLTEEADTMSTSDRLSAALGRTGMLPPEYGAVVQNGELAGDVPGAVMNMAQASEAEFNGRDGSFVHLARFLFYIPLAILMIFILSSLYTRFYGGVVSHFTVE